MCLECGCGLGGEGATLSGQEPRAAAHPHTHEHTHEHAHEHGWADQVHDPHEHPVAPGGSRLVELNRSLLEKNARLAERNRGFSAPKSSLS